MSIRFSRVTAITARKAAIFLVGGVPASLRDLEPWTAFRDFTKVLSDNESIAVTTETFEYGEEEPFDATPEEIAYLYMRENHCPGFIQARTRKTNESIFFINHI